jgi:hypothetical protein
MRLLILGLLAAASAIAATRVSDVLYDGVGARMNGTCVVSWPSFTTQDLRPVSGGSRSLTIRNGVMDVTLEPTVGASPRGVLYRVQCSSAGLGASPVEWWDVPVSNAAVLVSAVRVATGGAQPLPAPPTTAGFADQESPVAVSSRSFDLAHAPSPASSLILVWNGLVQRRGIDYTLVGARIYFGGQYAPSIAGGDSLLAWYRW